MRPFLLAVAMVVCAIGAGPRRPIAFGDMPHELLSQLGIVNAGQFDQVRDEIARKTVERVRQGEQEALAYFILQSASFTSRPAIEPAVSARQYRDGKGEIPSDVRARIVDFLAAVKKPAEDERLRWFAEKHPSGQDCESAFQLAAEFLYPQNPAANSQRAGVYQTRGLSTDTHLEANKSVLAGLDAIRAKVPAERFDRVLIVGPGLEFAPRSGLRDVPPQSFQPYVLLDALLRRKMAEADRVVVDCVDVNPQVIQFIRRRPKELVMPGVPAEESAIGTWRGENLQIRPEMAARVSAEDLNIITGRYTGSYDLVIATNVLIYFSTRELALALANIQAMLRPGGWLVHNETRREFDDIARALGLPLVETKMVTLAQNGRGAATDMYLLHRKP